MSLIHDKKFYNLLVKYSLIVIFNPPLRIIYTKITNPLFTTLIQIINGRKYSVLGDPEVTANIYCKSRNPPNTDTQKYSTDFTCFYLRTDQ